MCTDSSNRVVIDLFSTGFAHSKCLASLLLFAEPFPGQLKRILIQLQYADVHNTQYPFK